MPFCAPQIVYSSVHVAATTGFTDTFTPSGSGLYRITVNVSAYNGNASYPSVRFGATITDAVGSVVGPSVSASAGPTTVGSADESFSFFLNASTPVSFVANVTGTLDFDTWFIVEQLA